MMEGAQLDLLEAKEGWDLKTISPIFFNLVMDVLSRLLEKVVEEKDLDTYMINGEKSGSHLVYADNILIFSRENVKSLRDIKEVLRKFTSF